MITLLELLKEEILISTASGDKLIIGTMNIVIECQINRWIEEVIIKNMYFVLIVMTTIILERLLWDKGIC